jgi:hypothetical protein
MNQETEIKHLEVSIDRVFENRVLMRIFGPKRVEIIVGTLLTKYY